MIQIRHRMPGRERLRIRALYRNPALGARLEEVLDGTDGIRRVRAKTICGSLVVRYDRRKLDPEALRRLIAPLAGEMHPANPVQADGITPLDCADCRKGMRPRKKRSWLGRIGTVVLLTGYLGYVLAREYILKRPVAQGALSPTGIVSLVAAFPLLQDAWKETFEEKRFTIHQFLAFSLLLGIFVGEALTAFEIIYVLRGAKLLEDYAADRSRRAIRRMLELSVKDAWVLADGVETQVPVDALQQGDLVVIRTGWKMPIDGTIEKGEALLDESTLTGRSEPEFKGAGDPVFAGSYLEKGVLYVRARKVGGDTYLARVAALVEASLDQKAPLQQRADELASRLLKLGTVATLLTLVGTRSLSRAFTVMLVMSCPCATILAASTAVSAAIHNAARRHILVKGGVYLEQIGAAKVYCFDKTGTITTEETEIATVVSDDEKALLYWAASAELRNPHALAGAIARRAEALGIEPDQHGVSEHILGKGVKASVGGSTILLGNRRMMLGEDIDVSEHMGVAQRLIEQGLTAVYVVKDGRPLGVIGIAHRLRPGTGAAFERLRATGVERIYLVSGDEQPVAEALSRQLGLDACHAELLPEDKARVVREMRRESGTLVMVGDGVNDALALAEADIGIAMGAGGSEVAIEVADIALADSDIQSLIYIRDLSRATLRTAEQNYYLAVGTNLVGIALGASGWLTPAMGGLIHIAHTLGILLNSSRLLTFKSKR
jgi:cation-transporting P-type ATPase C